MLCARSTFLQVIGKNAPAFTVASLAMTMNRRPHTVPIPVTTAPAGAPPHSLYIPKAGKRRELEKRRAGIDQRSNALACGETSLGVLTLDPGGSTAEADGLLLLAKFSDERGHDGRVPSKLGARHIDPRNQSVRR